MAGKQKRQPTLGVHKGSGLARAVIDGQHRYFGKPGPEAERRFRAALAAREPTEICVDDIQVEVVADLVAAFLVGHKNHYRRADGSQTGELNNYRAVFRFLLAVYATHPVTEFSPKCLKRVRSEMEKAKLSRNYVNAQVRRLTRLFKWGVSEELVPAKIHHALRTIEALQPYRSEARETEISPPVPAADIEAVLPHLPRPVVGMIQLQLLSGMRPGEVVQIRMCDIDRSAEPWTYRPPQHKTKHKGKPRAVDFGPEARELLQGFFKADRHAPLFSPLDAETERAKVRRVNRKSPVPPSQAARGDAAKRRERARPPGESYTTNSYRRVIHRACERVGVEKFGPGRLRKNAATAFEEKHGLALALLFAGHSDARSIHHYVSRESGRQRLRRAVEEGGVWEVS